MRVTNAAKVSLSGVKVSLGVAMLWSALSIAFVMGGANGRDFPLLLWPLQLLKLVG